jgi:predicted RNase H-like HicB family nuclease
MSKITVVAEWDDEASVWVASSKDVPGLITEAATAEILMKKLMNMIPELLEENGHPDGDVLFDLVATRQAIAHRQYV